MIKTTKFKIKVIKMQIKEKMLLMTLMKMKSKAIKTTNKLMKIKMKAIMIILNSIIAIALFASKQKIILLTAKLFSLP